MESNYLDSRCRNWLLASLELDRREHTQGRVTALPVVEDLEVFEDCTSELQARRPASSVQQLNLHPAPATIIHSDQGTQFMNHQRSGGAGDETRTRDIQL